MLLQRILFFMYLSCVGSVIGRGGRCQLAPYWSVQGRNPIIEHAANGNIVVVTLVSSKSRRFLRYTLDTLENYGKYYTWIVRQKVKIIVINTGDRKLHGSVNEYFQNLIIYNGPEPSILRQLKAGPWDVLVYDTCARMQFQYSYPSSWVGFPFLPEAVSMIHDHSERICGKCTSISSLSLSAREQLIRNEDIFESSSMERSSNINSIDTYRYSTRPSRKKEKRNSVDESSIEDSTAKLAKIPKTNNSDDRSPAPDVPTSKGNTIASMDSEQNDQRMVAGNTGFGATTALKRSGESNFNETMVATAVDNNEDNKRDRNITVRDVTAHSNPLDGPSPQPRLTNKTRLMTPAEISENKSSINESSDLTSNQNSNGVNAIIRTTKKPTISENSTSTRYVSTSSTISATTKPLTIKPNKVSDSKSKFVTARKNLIKYDEMDQEIEEENRKLTDQIERADSISRPRSRYSNLRRMKPYTYDFAPRAQNDFLNTFLLQKQIPRKVKTKI